MVARKDILLVTGSAVFSLAFWRDLVVTQETWSGTIFMTAGVLGLGGFLVLLLVLLAIEVFRTSWQAIRITRHIRLNAECFDEPPPGSIRLFFMALRSDFLSFYDWKELRSGGRFYHRPWAEKKVMAEEEAEREEQEGRDLSDALDRGIR